MLALPFLAVVAATRGLDETVHTFHWTDERVYHIPTIQLFARELPLVHLNRYPAAQTPLFHVILAIPTRLTGLHLASLRFLNVTFTWAAALVLHRLLVRRLGLTRWAALAPALLFAVSPYVFGASFLLLTDNLALLLGVLAVERLLAVRERPSLGGLAAAAGWTCLADLTRQSCVWLLALTAFVAVRTPLPARRRVLALGAVVLAAAPLLALVATWHGLVPAGSDPSSCGLCGHAAPR